ncbi:hypothetical protein BDM02DRAFT_3271713 [Thelephora ganbajun]|uniref:Uncharacterized protein n=1 Tax=Thelephora ganbajun TaxID=370292 RepID=A0ACB6Z7D8_THEGA|nr:hypothetical protein BDM02DRAFT_3271713 [Thelephora ganbajun]
MTYFIYRVNKCLSVVPNKIFDHPDLVTAQECRPIDAGTDVQLAPALSKPANAKGNDGGGLDAATIKSLAPELGFKSGINPWRDVYLNALVKGVQAGTAVNGPSVKVTFPTDNSKQSQSARIAAALITLQNLNGPGKGCPAVSTTLLAVQKASAA